MSEHGGLANKELTVTEFLREVKREQVSGREFLALIGHSRISNEDYTEIKETPSLTYKRLVEILVNSPLVGEDYQRMLDTMRERRAFRERIKRERAEKAAVFADSIAENTENIENNKSIKNTEKTEKTEITEITEEITLGGDSEDIEIISVDDAESAEFEELWGGGAKLVNTEQESKKSYFDEYGENEDFDENAPRENRAKKIICLCLMPVLVFLSFFIRFHDTGSWFFIDNSYKPPENYADLFALLSKQSAVPDSTGDFAGGETVPQKQYRAENFGNNKSVFSSVVSVSGHIFTVSGDSIDALRITNGKISGASSYKNDNLIGIFAQKDRLFAVYSDEYAVGFDYDITGENDEIIAKRLEFNQPCADIKVFDAANWNGVPIEEYRQDGVFSDIIVKNGGVLLMTRYAVNNTVFADNPDGYIPSRTLSGERSYIPFENITFTEDSPYNGITVIGAFSGTEADCFAVTGAYASGAYLGDNALLLTLPVDNRTELIKYSVFGNALSNPVTALVDGAAPDAYADIRNGVIRAAAFNNAGETADYTSLYVFDDNMTLLSSVEKIAPGETPRGIAFDEKRAYIIAEKLYAIDTSRPESPLPVSEINAMISDKEYYGWGENNFVSIGVEADEYGNRLGIRVNMYAYKTNSAPEIEGTILLAPPNPAWNDSVASPVEKTPGAAAVSYGSGIIVVPVIYADDVMRVEKYFVLSYDDINKFTVKGDIHEYVNAYSGKYASAVADGYIYCFFGDMIQSAATDTTIVDIYNK